MKSTYFDASAFANGLNAAYDPVQTHFSFLEDSEITGGGAWRAQPGENLHLTIQNTDHSTVAHYFYEKSTGSWRYHGYGGAPIPYGTHTHDNLKKLQQRAIDFAWPSMVHFVDKKQQKTDSKMRRQQAQAAKKAKQQAQLKELFADRDDAYKPRPMVLKPVRFPPPPAGRVTEIYMAGLIQKDDTESLEYLFRSDEWPLEKWESAAWTRFLDWLTSP